MGRSSRLAALALALLCVATGGVRLTADTTTLPVKAGSVRFAVIGDTGRGTREQQQVADQMAARRVLFPFDFTIMLGDNIYEYAGPDDYIRKFERPYAALLGAGVKFYAAIGNHDPPSQEHYARFNMEGRRYYTYRVGDVRFFVLNSTSLDARQLTWLIDRLSASQSRWKIVYMHHPVYTSGRYARGASALRRALEPLFLRYGVDAVFSGHEHFYERLKPQGGITYFISGGGGSLRRGDIRPDAQLASGFDHDLHFMLVEIAGDELYFETISRTGQTVDHGVIRK